MATYFVQATGGNDANDGLDNIGAGLATATWTESTLTLTQASHGYTFSTGDLIYISGGTGATVGLYQVASATANDIVLVGTSTLPGVGNGTAFAAGDLSTGDITSSSGAKATLGGAEALVASGDRIWCRGGTAYGETLNLTAAGTDPANAVEWIGYTTTIGDDGRFVIDGASTRTYGITDLLSGNANHLFLNMEIKGTTTAAANLPALANLTFRNCYIHDTTGGLGSGGDNWTVDRCVFQTITSGAALEADANIVVTSCTFKACTGAQCIRAEGGSVIGCLMFDMSNTTHAIELFFNTACLVAGNTLYGATGSTSKGVFVSGSGLDNVTICNNIISNFDEGISRDTDDWSSKFWASIYNNVMFGNTANYSNMPTSENEVTSDPLFTSVAGDDYTVGNTSPAVDAGYTAFDNTTSPNQDSNLTIGAFQLAPGGGAGVSGIINGGIM